MEFINLDTNEYQNRITLGLNNEKNFKKNLDQTSINFIETNRYFTFDYYYQTNNNLIFIELKTRTFKKNTYNTAIIAKNKLTYFLEYNTSKLKSLYLVYGFVNNNNSDIEYYYLKFNKKIFKTFKLKTIFNKIHFEIPIVLLKPFNNFMNDIQFDLTIRNNIDQ